MSEYESDLSVEQIFSKRELPEPCIVTDKDTETLEWIHGTDIDGTEYNVQLSSCDISYLIEHLFLNMMNLMLGRDTLGGAYPDTDGEEQLRNWRLINLLCIKSEATDRCCDMLRQVLYRLELPINIKQCSDVIKCPG